MTGPYERERQVEKRTLITAADVAEEIGFAPRTVVEMARRGEFEGVAFEFGTGRRKRLRFDAVKFRGEWMEAHGLGAPAGA